MRLPEQLYGGELRLAASRDKHGLWYGGGCLGTSGGTIDHKTQM